MTDAAIRDAFDAAVDNQLPYLDLRVTFDDGSEFVAHADQRDMRRAEIAIGGDPEADKIGFLRACAWAYLTRMSVLELGWSEFDNTVPFVLPLKDQTTADPTGTATAG